MIKKCRYKNNYVITYKTIVAEPREGKKKPKKDTTKSFTEVVQNIKEL